MSLINSWSAYYNALDPLLQPNEYLLKLLLGQYVGKTNFLYGKSWREAFKGKKVLDVSFGDGRNVILLEQLAFTVFGTEISDEIKRSALRNLSARGLKLNEDNFRVGFNHRLPFPNNFFDFLISWNSLYYLDSPRRKISDNFVELSRVLKSGGFLLGSVPGHLCYSYKGAHNIDNERVVLNPQSNAAWGNGVLNGQILYKFISREHFVDQLSNFFESLEVSEMYWDGFGSAPLHYYIFIAKTSNKE